MIVKYGTHTHRAGEIALTVQKQHVLDGKETPYAEDITWTMDGLLISTEATESAARADIKTQTAALEADYSLQFKDAGLYMPDGSTLTAHYLTNSELIGGVRVIQPPHYPLSSGTEAVNHRTYRIVLAARKPIGAASRGNVILSMTETVDSDGGGPMLAFRETLMGQPRRYWSRMSTVCYATQKGEAVGLLSYPPIPAPIWPSERLRYYPTVVHGSPKRIGNDWVEWPISWEYRFGSVYQLSGTPHVWGITY